MTAAPSRHAEVPPRPRRAPWPAGVRWIAGALFVLSVPLVLITTNVLQLAAEASFYQRGFARYEVGRTTGLGAGQLEEIARAFIAYFDGRRPDLNIVVELGGTRRPLFNEREIEHMRDVRNLMSLVRGVQLGAAATLLGVTVAGYALRRRHFHRPLARLCLLGAGLTLGVLVLLGGLSLLDFSEAFIRFHQLAFSNDLWILDPRRDYLIMLFPQGFWFDATMRIALWTTIQALAVGALGLTLHRWASRR